jgi:hypothetical protein
MADNTSPVQDLIVAQLRGVYDENKGKSSGSSIWKKKSCEHRFQTPNSGIVWKCERLACPGEIDSVAISPGPHATTI